MPNQIQATLQADDMKPKSEQAIINDIKAKLNLTGVDEKVRNGEFNIVKQMYLGKHSSPLLLTTESRLHNAKLFGGIQKQIAKMTIAVPVGTFVPLNDSVKSKQLELNEDFINRCELDHMQLKSIRALTQQSLYGFVVGRMTWKTMFELMRDPKKNKQVKQKTMDSWSVKVYAPEDSYLDPSHDPSVPYCEARWGIVREWMTLTEMENINKLNGFIQWKNLGTIKTKIKSAASAKGAVYQFKGLQSTDAIRQYQSQSEKKQDSTTSKIEILWKYSKKRWQAYTPTYNEVVLDIENPFGNFIPLVVSFSNMADDSMYGISDVEMIKDVISADNALMSIYMDAIGMTINPMIKLAPGQESKGIVIAKGRFLRETVQNGITPFQIQDNFTSSFQQAHVMLTQNYQDAMGDNDNVLSSKESTAIQNTATGIKQAAQDGDIRIKQKLKLYSELWIKPIAEMSLKLCNLFVDEGGQTVPIFNKQAINYFSKRQSVYDDKVQLNGKTKRKFRMDENGKHGYLTMMPQDYFGLYGWKVETDLDQNLSDQDQLKALESLVEDFKDPNVMGALQSEGKVPNWSEILERKADLIKLKNFQDLLMSAPEQQQQQGQQAPTPPVPHVSVSMPYQYTPQDVQGQIEQAAGYQPSPIHQQSDGQLAPKGSSQLPVPQMGTGQQLQQSQQMQIDPNLRKQKVNMALHKLVKDGKLDPRNSQHVEIAGKYIDHYLHGSHR